MTKEDIKKLEEHIRFELKKTDNIDTKVNALMHTTDELYLAGLLGRKETERLQGIILIFRHKLNFIGGYLDE